MSDLQAQVDKLIRRAVHEQLPAQAALHFSQAALNIANTKHAMAAYGGEGDTPASLGEYAAAASRLEAKYEAIEEAATAYADVLVALRDGHYIAGIEDERHRAAYHIAVSAAQKVLEAFPLPD